jgi:peptidoglycan/LPS O-acetylase OafA/YrhL
MTSPNARNARIDGWRGVSIALVVVGHALRYRLGAAPTPYEPALAAMAALGVDVFFLISGFLITSILLAEERGQGRIHIAAFYLRRAFRILPAFAAMLAAAVLMGRYGLIDLPEGAAWRSGLFVCNFSGASCSWWLAHTWSLSVEEQFYWVWPAMFLLPAEPRKMCLMAMVVCLPVGALYIHASLASFEFIAVGAAVALFDEIAPLLRRLATTRLYPAAFVAALGAALLAEMPGWREIGRLSLPPLLALVVFGALSGSGWVARLISWRPAQKVGIVSYSLYLWQQFSLAPLQWVGTPTGAGLFLREHAGFTVAFAPVAVASYYVLERPLIAVGRRLSSALIARRAAAQPALSFGRDA